MKKINRSIVILISAFVCLVSFSSPVFGVTYEETINVYQPSGGVIMWDHTYDHSADPIATVTLTIVADDVDAGENDRVWVQDKGGNWHNVGELNDKGYAGGSFWPGPGNPPEPRAITTTTFNIDPSWINGLPIAVKIEPGWVAEIETSTLTVVQQVSAPEPTIAIAAIAALAPALAYGLVRRRKNKN